MCCSFDCCLGGPCGIGGVDGGGDENTRSGQKITFDDNMLFGVYADVMLLGCLFGPSLHFTPCNAVSNA